MKIVNLKREENQVYIGRGSPYGNKFKIGADGNRAEVIEKFKLHLLSSPDLQDKIKKLKGKVLGCYCSPLPCHGDVIINFLKGELN